MGPFWQAPHGGPHESLLDFSVLRELSQVKSLAHQAASLVQRFIKIFTYQGVEMSSFFQRCTTGAALIPAMPSTVLCLSSAFDLTRIWRRKVCAIFPKRVSTKLSHDPCLGVWT